MIKLKLIASISVLSLVPVAYSQINNDPRIINEALNTDVGKVWVQKMTFQCSVFSPNGDGWETVTRIYTLHLMDQNSLRGLGFKSRPYGHGWYSWEAGKWFDFADITENVIWLENVVYLKLGSESSLCANSRCTSFLKHDSPFDIYINFDKGISRVNPHVVYDNIEYKCARKYGGDNCPGFLTWSKWKIPSDRSECSLIEYKKPPDRIGF